MAFESICPHCGKSYRATAEQVGQLYTCTNCSASCITPSQEIDPGMVFGDYEVRYPLGAGSTGEVHLATERSTNLPVALKILMLAEDAQKVDVQRFVREARTARSFEHPVLVRIYDAGQTDKYYWLAMEYVKGETLDRLLKHHGVFSETDALAIVRDVADAMRYAWEHKELVHRDIKPSNIMLSYAGATKLMDLGIAKSFLHDLTVLTDPDMVIGSPPYMSPEQCAPGKRLDQRSDIYSLGATLYQLLTEEFAFEGSTPQETLKMQLFSPLPDPRRVNPKISIATSELIKKMMAKSASARYQSWAAFIATVDQIRAAQP